MVLVTGGISEFGDTDNVLSAGEAVEFLDDPEDP